MWTSLRCFDQLEVLEMSVDEGESEEFLLSLFSVVASIDTLWSLTLRMRVYPRHPTSNVFCSLTNLQSLSLLSTAIWRSWWSSVCVSQLTRLTSLALEGVSIEGSIVPLDQLVYLSLVMLPPVGEDLSNALIQLTKLTELVWNECRPILPNHILSQLKNLRRLRLDTRDVLDSEFFQSLASLPYLTSLTFSSISEQASLDSFQMQFTVLTQLQQLELSCKGTKFDVFGRFGEGTFPRLKYLAFTHPKLEESDGQILFKRFPCLRSFKTLPERRDKLDLSVRTHTPLMARPLFRHL